MSVKELPELIGPADRVAWAERLRAARLPELAQTERYHRNAIALHPHLEETLSVGIRAVEAIRGQVFAAWWIRNRDVSTGDLLRAWMRRYGPMGGGRSR